jgi:hypothetical protein
MIVMYQAFKPRNLLQFYVLCNRASNEAEDHNAIATFEQLGEPRVRYHSRPSARYGYSNLAFFGSEAGQTSLPL